MSYGTEVQRDRARISHSLTYCRLFFFFQAEDGIRDLTVTGVQTCALPIYPIPASAERWPIHRETPKFVDLEPKTEVFETGIKVIDLIAPFVKGGKIGLFG